MKKENLIIDKRISIVFELMLITVLFAFFISTEVMVYAKGCPIVTTKTSLSITVDANETVYLSGESVDAASWKSSNTNVVKIVTSTSRKAVIKGVGKGYSDIIATDKDGNKAVCKISVLNPDFLITKQLVTAVEEEEEIYVQEGEAIKWRSSNNNIVSIKEGASSYAVIRAESVGSVAVTATDKYGTEATCTVKVRQENFKVGLSTNYGAEEYIDEADFSSYTQEIHYDGWWDNDYFYHEPHDESMNLLYYKLEVYEGSISKCTVSNDSVVSVVKAGSYYYIYPKGVGDAVITVIDSYGEKETIKCNVTLNYFIEMEAEKPNYEQYLSDNHLYNNLQYGDETLKGITYPRSKVIAIIDGKEYTSNSDDSGNYSIKVPKYLKINTPIIINISRYGVIQSSFKKTIVNNNPQIKISSVKKKSKKVVLTLKNVHKGDYIILTVGKKKYTKRIKKDTKKITYRIKTKKQKKGKKVTATLYNKYDQKLKNKVCKIR